MRAFDIVDENVVAVEAVEVMCGRLDGCSEMNVEMLVGVVEVGCLSAAPRRR